MKDFVFSKKDKRHFSEFQAQECFYDSLTGQLDIQRARSLEEHLKTHPTAELELQKLSEALRYVETFAKIQISSHLIEEIRTPTTFIHVLVQKLRINEWSDGLRLAAEGVLVSTLALVLISVIPWGRLMSLRNQFDKGSVTLAEVARGRFSDSADNVKSSSEQPKQEPALFEDESKPTGSPPEPHQNQASAPTIPNSSMAQQKNSSTAEPAPEVDNRVSASAPDSAKRQGWLYRGTMSIAALEANTPKLVESITNLGGRKAGEVELGWKKGSGRYFHFTLPEAQLKQLQATLKPYGALKLSKESHPRIMPDGIIRLIVIFDEKGSP